MSSFLLQSILLLILNCIILCHSAKPKESWFSFPITNQSHPLTQQMISNAIQQLSENGVFHLENVLSPKAIKSFKSKIKRHLQSNGMTKPSYKSNKVSTNIFSDSGDPKYSDKHPRNKKLKYSISGIPRYQLSRQFIAFYEYEPLIDFLRTIVTSTIHELPLCDPWIFDCKQWKNLYIGTTKETASIYVGVLINGDSAGYHLDEEGLTCAFIIDEAEYGGEFMYQWIAPKPKQKENIIQKKEKIPRGHYFEWNWKFIKKVINEDIGVKSFMPTSGDLHCFKGNITVHKIDYVEGDNIRTAIVMSFYDENPGLTKPVQEMVHIEL